MTKPSAGEHFNGEQAKGYDERFARLAPLKDALHLCAGFVMHDIPDDARVLCVGAGTGAEVLALGAQFPRWHFTIVEPAGAMLDICRTKADAAGMSARCTFHQGEVSTLAPSDAFDAATAFLVSHFLYEVPSRIAFYNAIASRLKAEGLLLSADLVANEMSTADEPGTDALFPAWLAMLRFTGGEPDKLAMLTDAWRDTVAVVPTSDLHDVIASAGFTRPVPFLQTLLIHASVARRAG